ncbi:hypothetical protein CWI38_0336p0020 [Hamiltosporidium tvaerminnensis]|uniref:Uncharacterized protein n=1 Tax=Hamiltosporidium tvaerminnensis TaxID=1176355 RepID=A0A4Q9LZD8_9MICR|nr:hypothetical protein CWI38_0336p0020 [Hamiltosporidium tvaerminnensis]
MAACNLEIDMLKNITLNKAEMKTRQEENEEIGDVVAQLENSSKLVDGKNHEELCNYPLSNNVNDAARILQAAQECYDEVTRKNIARFGWKENIEIICLEGTPQPNGIITGSGYRLITPDKKMCYAGVSDNQLGAHNLKEMWIEVIKTYNSIDPTYLFQ